MSHVQKIRSEFRYRYIRKYQIAYNIYDAKHISGFDDDNYLPHKNEHTAASGRITYTRKGGGRMWIAGKEDNVKI